MKRITTALLLTIALTAHGEQLVKTFERGMNATGGSTSSSLVGTGTTVSRIYWSPVGTVSTCTLTLETSPDNTTWTTLISGQTCTTNGASAYVPTSTNYVRFNLTTLTGGGAVLGYFEGYNDYPVTRKTTYSFATTAKTATAAGTAPFFSICGSATKTVTLQRLVIGGTVATAAVYADVELRKTSTATAAGTPVALVKVPLDSAAPASTANLLNYYTALATAGTAVGNVASRTAVFPITGTVAVQAAEVVFDWPSRTDVQPPVLRGTAQCIEAYFGTTTTNAPTLTVQGTYSEE